MREKDSSSRTGRAVATSTATQRAVALIRPPAGPSITVVRSAHRGARGRTVGGQRQMLATPGKAADGDGATPEQEGRRRGPLRISDIVLGHVLQEPGDGVQPEPARDGGVTQPDHRLTVEDPARPGERGGFV